MLARLFQEPVSEQAVQLAALGQEVKQQAGPRNESPFALKLLASRPSRVGGLRAPAGTWLQRPVRTSSKGCGARSSRRFTLAPLLLYKTDNSPRVRNGYTSLGTHGHARALRTHLKGPICRRNVIADARLWTPVPVG
jgi:hypothetical protein